MVGALSSTPQTTFVLYAPYYTCLHMLVVLKVYLFFVSASYLVHVMIYIDLLWKTEWPTTKTHDIINTHHYHIFKTYLPSYLSCMSLNHLLNSKMFVWVWNGRKQELHQIKWQFLQWLQIFPNFFLTVLRQWSWQHYLLCISGGTSSGQF